MFVKQVESLQEVLEVSHIRNTGREFMTHNTNYITDDEQLAWWRSLDHSRHKIFLFYTDTCRLIGFGMLKLDASNTQWATLALYPEYRGAGYGTKIYTYLTNQAYDDLWIEVLSNNVASLKAAENAGFVEQWRNSYVVTLVWSRQ